MPATVVLAPACAGKTRDCLRRVRETLAAEPLAEVWVVLPDRLQAVAFRRRLAEAGGALGAAVGTFGDVYAELLARSGRSLPQAPDPLVNRLLRAAISDLADRGDLPHYHSIANRPGFAHALGRLIAELKRARIEPPQFANAAGGRGPRLEELAALYAEYQNLLIALGWADAEGLGWLAVQALENDPGLAADWRLLIADGFDSFTPTQLETLRLLANRVRETRITLTGAPGMPRPAHRRFARTLERIQDALAPEIVPLEPREAGPAPLAHLERSLFERDSLRLGPAERVTFVETQNPAMEAREAMRWLKARIVRDGVGPEQCAVIAPALDGYRPFLREAAREFGMPLRFARGEPLGESPLIAAILNLVGLSPADWPRRALLDALRSPYFDLTPFGLGPRDAASLDEVARWGRVVGGLAQWQEALERLARRTAGANEISEEDDEASRAPRLPEGGEAQRLWDAVSAFAARATPPGTGRAAEYVRWLNDLLDALDVEARLSGGDDVAKRDLAALDAFYALLDSLALAETVAPRDSPLGFSEFLLELRSLVASESFQPDELRGVPAVLAADLHASRGVPFVAVAVLGLSEGVLPASLSEDPFLSDDERESLRAAGLPLEPRLRSDQQTLFYEAVTRATDFLLLTRPTLAEDGETWVPSPYWALALRLFDTTPHRIRTETARPLDDAASPTELLEWAVRARRLPARFGDLVAPFTGLRHAADVLWARQARAPKGEFEGQVAALGDVLASRYGPDHVWSASRLEAYGGCGFRFFLGHALGLEPREPPEFGFDSAQLGSMLHEALERLYRDARDPADLDALLARMPGVADAVFDDAPERHGFRPTALWRAQREEMLRWLEGTVRELAALSGVFRPRHFELRFGTEAGQAVTAETRLGPVRLRGKIDRVDEDGAGGLRVIDYKTGSSGLTARELEEGRRLQLPMYALAAERLGLGEAVEGFYWGIRRAEASDLKLSKFGPDEAIETALEHVAAHVAGMRAGEFRPIPPPGGCPDYCLGAAVCWRYTPRAW